MERSFTGNMRSSSLDDHRPDMSDLNIMLLGSVGSGKSASGNTILGNRVFKEGFSTESVTETCKSAQTEIDGQIITVFDTVGLCDGDVEKITEARTEIEKMIESTDIDVFLLVIKLGETFTKEKSEIVKWILQNFGAKVLNHTIVLFTHGDQLQQPIDDYLSKDEALRSVVDQCSGGVHVFNNRDGDRAQVTELLEKINTLMDRYTEQDCKNTPGNLLLLGCVSGAAAVFGAGIGAVYGSVFGERAAAFEETRVSDLGIMVRSSAAPPAGQAALEGAAAGAVIAALAAGVVCLLGRKYLTREKDKRD